MPGVRFFPLVVETAMFNVAYRRVVNPELPEAVRFLAFLWCVESYCWLTGQRFQATYLRVGHHLGFDWAHKPDQDKLLLAADLMRRERRQFLRKLEDYSEMRRKEKAGGKRQPSETRRRSLYHPDWLETSGGG